MDSKNRKMAFEVVTANNSGRMCDDHPDRPAVLLCENMGYAYCEECRDTTEMRVGCGYCPNVGHCEIQAYYNELKTTQPPSFEV